MCAQCIITQNYELLRVANKNGGGRSIDRGWGQHLNAQKHFICSFCFLLYGFFPGQTLLRSVLFLSRYIYLTFAYFSTSVILAWPLKSYEWLCHHSWTVVEVKRSAILPSIPMIWVRIPLKSSFFSVKFVFENTKINKNVPGLAHLKNLQIALKASLSCGLYMRFENFLCL